MIPCCYIHIMCNGLNQSTIIKQIKPLVSIPPICLYPLTCLLEIHDNVTIAFSIFVKLLLIVTYRSFGAQG